MTNRKDKFDIYYHIFADNKDFYESTFKTANKKFNELKLDGEKNIRLYQCWYDTLEHAIETANGNFQDGWEYDNCLRSLGEFPW